MSDQNELPYCYHLSLDYLTELMKVIDSNQSWDGIQKYQRIPINKAHNGVCVHQMSGTLPVIHNPLLPPDGWVLANTPIPHLAVGDHVLENILALPKGFTEEQLRAALTEAK